jgi:hypothetical protein
MEERIIELFNDKELVKKRNEIIETEKSQKAIFYKYNCKIL